MKKTITTVLLGILLIGTLGAAVVSAVASDDAKANNSFGQMHQWCGKYMDSSNFNSNENGSMHRWCGEYMNSGSLKLNGSAGQTNIDSVNNQNGFSCH
jgi:hypothetical protein